MNKYIILVSLFILLISCAQPRKMTGSDAGESVRFGKTGGFTNIPMEYALQKNRRVYEIAADTANPVNRISRKEMKEIAAALDSMDFKSLTLNEPGNMTYFVLVRNESWQNRIQWSDNTNNEQVRNLYKLLLKTINK
jgi:hypothetical protein